MRIPIHRFFYVDAGSSNYFDITKDMPYEIVSLARDGTWTTESVMPEEIMNILDLHHIKLRKDLEDAYIS